jgi:hypothetical protein
MGAADLGSSWDLRTAQHASESHRSSPAARPTEQIARFASLETLVVRQQGTHNDFVNLEAEREAHE